MGFKGRADTLFGVHVSIFEIRRHVNGTPAECSFCVAISPYYHGTATVMRTTRWPSEAIDAAKGMNYSGEKSKLN